MSLLLMLRAVPLTLRFGSMTFSCSSSAIGQTASLFTRLPDSLRVVGDHFLSVCPTTLTVDLLEKGLLAAEKRRVAVGASQGDPRKPPSLRGVLPPPSCPLLPLLLRPTSLVSSRSALRLPRAGDAAPARARGARALEGLAGAVEVVVEAVEGVGVVVGVVVGVEVSVAAVEAEEAAAVAEGAEAAEAVEAVEAAEVAEAAAAAVDLVAALRRGVAPVVVRASSSRAVVRPCPLSSFVSGTLRVSAVGVRVPAPTFSAPATALVSSAGARTPPSAASAA
ncbi:unnamed protein product [Closterium sp. NIES-65]|nr:unnamed protein product [Closterium sp. NIES-65]